MASAARVPTLAPTPRSFFRSNCCRYRARASDAKSELSRMLTTQADNVRAATVGTRKGAGPPILNAHKVSADHIEFWFFLRSFPHAKRSEEHTSELQSLR